MLIIKIGGGKTINRQHIIADLKNIQEPCIIVHGGNAMIATLAEKFGREMKYYTSPNGQISRATDQQIIDFMYMSYAGYMNKTIVAACQKEGINAIGLSGIDGRLIEGKRHESIIAIKDGKKRVIRDDLTGSVERINKELLTTLLVQGFTPIITPPILSVEGEAINTDGDKIAAKIATDLQAKTLLFLIEAAGFLTNFPKEDSLITNMKHKKIETYLPQAQGRMKKKLLMSKAAIEQGAQSVIIADGRIDHPIAKAMQGGGTHVYA